MNKDIPNCWKTWNSKFKKDICKQVNIEGCTDDNDIANKFAVHFKNVFCKSSDDTTACGDNLQKRSECILANY